jgi:hypothetical protein
MISPRCRIIALALGVSFFAGQAFGQDKDLVVEGQVKLGVHKFKLENTSLYQFEVKAKGFMPVVNLQGAFIQNTADFIREQDTFRGLYMPSKNGEYTIIVSPNTFVGKIPEGLLDYKVTLKTMKINETPVLKKDDKITADDERLAQAFRKTRFKAYTVKMTKGTTYIIDMVKAGGMDNKLNPYLILENPKKLMVAQDDDSGGFPNARIMYRALDDGEFRIIATGLSDFGGLGDYTLTVRTVKDNK